MYVCKYVCIHACVCEGFSRVRFSPSASLGVSMWGVVFLLVPPLVVRGCLLGGCSFLADGLWDDLLWRTPPVRVGS